MKTNLTKMNRIFIRSLTYLLCFFAVSASAQAPLALSLDSAINYAIDHNRTLINSRLAVNKSVEKVWEAKSSGLPQVSASMDYTNYLGAEASLHLSEQAPPVTIEFNPTSNFKASVSQLVFNGSYYVGVQLAKLGKSITEQSYQKDELSVKEQTIQAYYLVLANEKILRIMKANRENAALMFEKTSNLANAGVVEQTDPKKLSIMVASIDNAIRSTERQLETAYNLLRLQLGLEPGQAVSLTSDIDEIANQCMLRTESPNGFDVTKNIDYQLLTMQGKIAEKQIDMKKSAYLPSVVGYFSRTEKIQKSKFDMTPNNVLGFSLNIPIYSSGQRSSQVSQARIDLDIANNTKELVSQQLSMQEKQLRFNYNNLLEQYKNQQKNVEVSREVLEKMKLKYQQGVISSLELTSANTDYLTAETNSAGNLLQLLNAELALRKINNNL